MQRSEWIFLLELILADHNQLRNVSTLLHLVHLTPLVLTAAESESGSLYLGPYLTLICLFGSGDTPFKTY